MARVLSLFCRSTSCIELFFRNCRLSECFDSEVRTVIWYFLREQVLQLLLAVPNIERFVWVEENQEAHQLDLFSDQLTAL